MLEISVRLANPPESLLAKYTRKEREFFFDYSGFVLRLLDSPQVKQCLDDLIAVERIKPNRPIDVRIMIFPARPITGRARNTLHGSYNQDSAQISLYPLKLPRDWIRQKGIELFRTPSEDLSEDEEKLLGEISQSAISTLIHEVLHVKLEGRNLSRYTEETIVRKLERKYADNWMEKLQRAAGFPGPSGQFRAGP